MFAYLNRYFLKLVFDARLVTVTSCASVSLQKGGKIVLQKLFKNEEWLKKQPSFMEVNFICEHVHL